MQPLALAQLSSVQGLPSVQLSAFPGLHAEPPQLSPLVQASPSSQGNVFATFLQPAVGSQVSVVQGLLSSQAGGTPATHTPAEQMSAWVQAFLSSQGAVLAVKLQPLAV